MKIYTALPGSTDNIAQPSGPLVPRWVWGLPLILSAALLLVQALNGFHTTSPRHGERKERWSGKNFASQTDVQWQPRASATAPGWDSERVWSGNDESSRRESRW